MDDNFYKIRHGMVLNGNDVVPAKYPDRQFCRIETDSVDGKWGAKYFKPQDHWTAVELRQLAHWIDSKSKASDDEQQRRMAVCTDPLNWPEIRFWDAFMCIRR